MGFALQMIDTGAARLRVAVQGKGPLIVLIHGFPEGWCSWRHQIPALANASYISGDGAGLSGVRQAV